MERVVRFLKEVRAEGHKVTWPSKQELLGSTIVTIVTTVIVSLFIFMVDKALVIAFKAIFGN
ncbi:MAG: preprotein translocase subunit SecE [Candidatus Zixiibacteriota bacterium]